MEMLRHYDSFQWDIAKFCFGQICVFIGACWYLHEKVEESKLIIHICGLLLPVISILLLLSGLFTLLCIVLSLQNRNYFCRVSRYINEHRKHALELNDFGFDNKSQMWKNCEYPKTVHGMSTQFLCIYLLTFCLAALMFGFAYVWSYSFCVSVIFSVLSIFVVLVSGYFILEVDIHEKG